MTNKEALKILLPVIEQLWNMVKSLPDDCDELKKTGNDTLEALKVAVKALEQTDWISVTKKLPADGIKVNVTWVNHNPASYYNHIKDKPFTDTAIYWRGDWYWNSVDILDFLEEYGSSATDIIDDDIEIIAWMPLPEPYKEE